jgi:hypothetical protein
MDKQRSTQHTHKAKDRLTRTTLKTGAVAIIRQYDSPTVR